MILYIFIFLLLAVLVYHIYHIKEGIVFTRSYFLDNYEKNNILIDRENETLEKNGKIINYKKINNKNGNIDIKPLTNKILQQNDIPISKSYTWNNESSDQENISNIQQLHFPLVVKPTQGEKGYGVTTNITTPEELIDCVNDLKKQDKIAFIEEQATGKEYRIMVFNDTIIGITMKSSPFVTGDGTHTINELIDQYNQQTKRYTIHTVDYNFIQKQGYTTSDVVPLDKKVIITNVKNMSNGSIVTYVDIGTVHPLNISLFQKINRVLDLKLSGIDYICEDLSIPYYLSGVVIEVNPHPGLDIHYDVYPDDKKDDFVSNIVDNVFM
jgi:cyanophycin synthetase